jgi:hypothetical protein
MLRTATIVTPGSVLTVHITRERNHVLVGGQPGKL